MCDLAGVARQTDVHPELGQVIRQIRQDRRVSQEALAHAAGISTSSLVRIETARANPTWTTVRSLARALNATITQIAARAEALEQQTASRDS